MHFKLRYMVFPVHQECKLVIDPVFPVTVNENLAYTLLIQPVSGWRRYGLRNRADAPTEQDELRFREALPLNVENGALTLSVSLPQEDWYYCSLMIGGELVEKLEIYALEPDLFAKQPYRGDNHMHTNQSDGRDTPMYMAAAACHTGCDYCVITDHWHYYPSVTARKFFENTGADYLIIRGEEVHSPDNPVHIINLGGNASVNEWWQKDETEYREAVKKEMENITEPVTDKDRYTIAACQVVFDRIRSVDGVAVLCHPNWILPHGFNETQDVTDYLFDHRRFEVLELIAGGAFEIGTQMQISYYHDKDTMPILGDSDSHACFGSILTQGNFTIVFADALDDEAIKSAIRGGMTVAGNQNKLYGDYRLVKFGYFLLKNFYEEHSKLRSQLGARLLRMATLGNNDDPKQLAALKEIRPSELYASRRYPAV